MALLDEIYNGLCVVRCGTAAQIAVHCRLTYTEITKNISALVRTKKAKKLATNATKSPRGKRANVYALVDFKGEWSEQGIIEFGKKRRRKKKENKL
jgi:hypothetical protein